MPAALRRTLSALLIGAAALGCARRRTNEDFIPSEPAAHHILEEYLASWQRGESGRVTPAEGAPIEWGDAVRSAGRQLEGFAILGAVPADTPRCFLVKLNLGNPAEERRERYVVVGLDPIWVLRYEEWEMAMRWEHPMPTVKKSP